MKIVLVDNSWHIGPTFAGLYDLIPELEIYLFRKVEFLLARLDLVNTADVLVTEQHLPLLYVGDYLTHRYNNLLMRFPDLVNNWEHMKAGERLVRFLRNRGVNIPIVFHTDSRIEDIDRDVMADPKVYYCGKSLDVKALATTINLATQGIVTASS